MGKFYFVRHGESEANAAGIVADKYSKLTQKGLEQARTTGNSLKQRKINLIMTSPFIRAQQTAIAIAGELDIELAQIKIIDELRERGLGECENKEKDMESFKFFDTDKERGFESHQEIIARMSLALEKIKSDVASKHIVVVGHAISGFFLSQVACGKKSFEEFEDFRQFGNTDIIEVDIKDD